MRLLLLNIFLFANAVNAYKFLVYSPNFGQSHTRYMGKLADVLVKGGHNVTLLMPVLFENNRENTGTKHVNNIVYVELGEELKKILKKVDSFLKSIWLREDTLSSFLFGKHHLAHIFASACKDVLENEELLERLKAENYDVAFAEPFTFCGFGLFELLGINRTISTVSAAVNEAFTRHTAQPRLPSFVPSLYATTGAHMNIFQRAMNALYVYFGTAPFDQTFEAEHAAFVQKYGEFKSIPEIFGQCSLIFENSHPYLNFPQPKLQSTIDIGGFAVDLSKEAIGKLDEKWDAVLNERPKTVFVSFGSVARSMHMPEEWKKSFVKLFESLPDVTFIWKYEEPTTIVDHLPNVHTSPWLPQNALLADRRLSLFITHGGLASTTEIAHLGVPAIVVPLFGDQRRNGLMLSRHGGALAYDKFQLGDEKKLIDTVKQVLGDESFAKNAKRLAPLLRERTVTVHNLIVKNAELVAKYGPLTSLDAYGRQLSFVQYYLLDVIAYFAVFIVFVLLLMRYFARKMYSAVVGSKQKVE